MVHILITKLFYCCRSGNQNATADRVIKFISGRICVTLVDALSAPGVDVLEGSFELQLQGLELNLNDFSGGNVFQHYVGSLQRISVRHNIHPQAGPSVPWQEVLSSPYLRKEVLALKYSVQLLDGQGESRMFLNF